MFLNTSKPQVEREPDPDEEDDKEEAEDEESGLDDEVAEPPGGGGGLEMEREMEREKLTELLRIKTLQLRRAKMKTVRARGWGQRDGGNRGVREGS